MPGPVFAVSADIMISQDGLVCEGEETHTHRYSISMDESKEQHPLGQSPLRQSLSHKAAGKPR